jgi:hypothetical protein
VDIITFSVLDPDAAKVSGASVLVAGFATYAMARASRRGALHWTRAVKVILLASLAILVASIAVAYQSGYYHVGHGGDSVSGFVVWVIMYMLVPLPAWLTIGTIGAVILGLRSARIARANGVSA